MTSPTPTSEGVRGVSKEVSEESQDVSLSRWVLRPPGRFSSPSGTEHRTEQTQGPVVSFTTGVYDSQRYGL